MLSTLLLASNADPLHSLDRIGDEIHDYLGFPLVRRSMDDESFLIASIYKALFLLSVLLEEIQDRRVLTLHLSVLEFLSILFPGFEASGSMNSTANDMTAPRHNPYEVRCCPVGNGHLQPAFLEKRHPCIMKKSRRKLCRLVDRNM